MEEKRLGDVAVTEGWAMMQHLTDDPAWLTRRLDFPRPDEFEAKASPSSCTWCGATRRSCSTRSSSTRPTTRRSSRTATSRSSATR